jgi:hypothetical protein
MKNWAFLASSMSKTNRYALGECGGEAVQNSKGIDLSESLFLSP